MFIEKIESRFERASLEQLVIELEDLGSIKKVRVTTDAKGSRKDWFCERIELTNLKTKKQFVFVAEAWLSKKNLSIDVPVLKDGREAIGATTYKFSSMLT